MAARAELNVRVTELHMGFDTTQVVLDGTKNLSVGDITMPTHQARHLEPGRSYRLEFHALDDPEM